MVALPSYFDSFGSEDKVSHAKRKLVSLYIGVLYLAPGISNPYLNFKIRRSEIIPLVPWN